MTAGNDEAIDAGLTGVAHAPPRGLDRLVRLSEGGHSPFLAGLTWPDQIPPDAKWTSDQLLTIHNTEFADSLDDATRRRLGRWESINFYSQNVHGERALTRDLVARIYSSDYLRESRYLYHFLREENEHMAMFAEFCLRYGQLLPDSRIDLGRREAPLVEEFLLFCRTILFEYYVDFYNRTAANDGSLPLVVVTINGRHHREEARHLGFSRGMIEVMHERLRAELDTNQMERVARYVEDYMINQIELVYSSRVYEMVGFDQPAAFRRQLLQHPGRRQVHLSWTDQPYRFFSSLGLFTRSQANIIDGYFVSQESAWAGVEATDPKRELRDWLESQVEGDVTISDDYDILEGGIVDSLRFMRFLTMIEKVSGKEMRLDEIDLDHVRSLNAIEKAFF